MPMRSIKGSAESTDKPKIRSESAGAAPEQELGGTIHMSNTPTPQQPSGAGPPNDAILRVHEAEYTALTMRLTYWITIQYAIYALAGAYVGFAIQAKHKLILGTLFLASVLVMLILGWLWLQTVEEMYKTVFYIERNLKPKIKPIIGPGPFWRWEWFLKVLDERTAHRFLAYERRWAVPVLFVYGLAIAVWRAICFIHQHQGTTWTWWDWWWVPADVYVAIMLYFKFQYVTKLRKRMVPPGIHLTKER